jgi:hypothetical protein
MKNILQSTFKLKSFTKKYFQLKSFVKYFTNSNNPSILITTILKEPIQSNNLSC